MKKFNYDEILEKIIIRMQDNRFLPKDDDYIYLDNGEEYTIFKAHAWGKDEERDWAICMVVKGFYRFPNDVEDKDMVGDIIIYNHEIKWKNKLGEQI